MSDRLRPVETPAGSEDMPAGGGYQEPGAGTGQRGMGVQQGMGQTGKHRNGGRILRTLALIAVAAGLVVLTAAACVFSYSSIHALAREAGVSASLAKAYPPIFDAMLVVAGCSVLALRGAGIVSRVYGWLCLLVLLVGLAGLAAVHAAGVHVPHRTAGITAAIVPWALVLVGFGLLLALLRNGRIRRNNHRSDEPALLPAVPTAVTPSPDIVPAVRTAVPPGAHIAPAATTEPETKAHADSRIGTETTAPAARAQSEPNTVPTPTVAADPNRSHEPVTTPGMRGAAGPPWTAGTTASPAVPSPAVPSPAAASPGQPSPAAPSTPMPSLQPAGGGSVVDPVTPAHSQEAERRTPAARPAEMQLRARVPRQHASETPPPGPAPLGHVAPDALSQEPPPGSETGQTPPGPGELNAAPTVVDESQTTTAWPTEPPAFERPHSSPTPPED